MGWNPFSEYKPKKFTYYLQYTENGLIAKLVEKGGPWLYLNHNIIDNTQYKVNRTDGVFVSYCILSGKLVRDLSYFSKYAEIYSHDVNEAFRCEGLRCPNAAEAVLVPSMDKQIGCYNRPLVMPVLDSRHMFTVYELANQGRILNCTDDYMWDERRFDFLGVYNVSY